MSETLFGLLADAGIRLKSYEPGHTEAHLLCPKCGGGNHRDYDLSVTIDADGRGATWKCHRGSCDWMGGFRLDADRAPPPKTPNKARPLSEPQTRPRPNWLYEFWEQRRIGKRTVDHFGLYAQQRKFRAKGGIEVVREAMVFPYRYLGTLPSRKYRSRDDKHLINQDVGNTPPVVFNADVLIGAETVYWVEGEPDVLAMHECGLRATVSLRDGSDKEAKFKPDDRRFEALNTHREDLALVKRFVLCGDMDAPGLALREELACRLGRHRCDLVTWPDGCKDAGDTLREHTGAGVLAAIEAAEPYPIKGIFRAKRGMLAEYAREPSPPTMGLGIASVDDKIRLPASGQLIALTGYPTHGKTTFTLHLIVHTAMHHDRRWLVFTPEALPWKRFLLRCAEVYASRSARGLNGMTEEELNRANDFLIDRVALLVDELDEGATVDWIIAQAEMVMLRDGFTDLLIDPWNDLESKRDRHESETEYIGRSLKRLRAFGNRHGCNVWVIAHPTKPFQGNGDDPPLGFDMSGSANWVNKPDVGITLWSPKAERPKAKLILWKSRDEELWGINGEEAMMVYDAISRRYRAEYTEMKGKAKGKAKSDNPFADEPKPHWSDDR